MANPLKMAISETIRTLHRRGWSQRRIAEQLGVNRETVARHLRRPEPDPKPAIAPTGSRSSRRRAKTSHCVPRLGGGRRCARAGHRAHRLGHGPTAARLRAGQWL